MGIFVRRIIIAMFAGSVNDNNYKSVFVGVMICFLMIQTQCRPFIVEAANKLESFLLCCLIFIIVLDLLPGINGVYQEIITSIVILIPFPLFLYFLLKYLKERKNNDGDHIGGQSDIELLDHEE